MFPIKTAGANNGDVSTLGACFALDACLFDYSTKPKSTNNKHFFNQYLFVKHNKITLLTSNAANSSRWFFSTNLSY